MKNLIIAFVERQRARAACRVMLAMDDHVLTDIGLIRSQLEDLARSSKAARA